MRLSLQGPDDIDEFGFNFDDTDTSILFDCNQISSTGFNFDFYYNQAIDAPYTQEQETADPGVLE
jgi:predicted RNA-binding protein with PIN domain